MFGAHRSIGKTAITSLTIPFHSRIRLKSKPDEFTDRKQVSERKTNPVTGVVHQTTKRDGGGWVGDF